MTKKKGVIREEEHAKLVLTFFGLRHLRSSYPLRHDINHFFVLGPSQDPQDPIITRLRKNKAWMNTYLNNLERDGVIKYLVEENNYELVDLKKIDTILAEEEEYGAQKLGWYLAPKKIACPWGENNSNDLDNIPVGDEISDYSGLDMEPKQISIEPSKTIKESNKELISLAETIKLTLNELPKALKSLLENNSTKEESNKVKNKLNAIENKLGQLENLINKRTQADRELEDRIATRISTTLLSTLGNELGPLKIEMTSVKSDISKASSEIHKVVDELNTCKAREAKFLYEYFSELAEGNKDGK